MADVFGCGVIGIGNLILAAAQIHSMPWIHEFHGTEGIVLTLDNLVNTGGLGQFHRNHIISFQTLGIGKESIGKMNLRTTRQATLCNDKLVGILDGVIFLWHQDHRLGLVVDNHAFPLYQGWVYHIVHGNLIAIAITTTAKRHDVDVMEIILSQVYLLVFAEFHRTNIGRFGIVNRSLTLIVKLLVATLARGCCQHCEGS